MNSRPFAYYLSGLGFGLIAASISVHFGAPVWWEIAFGVALLGIGFALSSRREGKRHG
jgi:sulfite exporter TauE/SafE